MVFKLHHRHAVTVTREGTEAKSVKSHVSNSKPKCEESLEKTAAENLITLKYFTLYFTMKTTFKFI